MNLANASQTIFSSASAPSASTSTAAPKRTRPESLDAFRGLTIIGMLIVNNPGDAAAAYSQLRHSAWNGCTLADLVFPFFLFVVGITTHLSLRGRAARGDDDSAVRRQIFRRGALIFVIGLLLNWFPFYHYGAIPGRPTPSFFDHVVGRLLELRLLGVLQRIGIAYVVAAFLTFRAPTRRVLVTIVIILVGYWLAMAFLPVPGERALGYQLLHDPARTLSAWVDRTTLDWSRWGLGNHIWESSRVYDPEGLLSTIPAIATTMIGVLVGRWMTGTSSLGKRLLMMTSAGLIMIVAGLAWSVVFPINKNLWSSSYVLFTAGVACLILAAIAWLVDDRQWRRWTRPLVVFGMNPITAYVGAELTAVLLDSTIKLRVGGRLESAHQLFHDHALASWLPPNEASLAYSLAFVALWYPILLVLYRRGIVLKV